MTADSSKEKTPSWDACTRCFTDPYRGFFDFFVGLTKAPGFASPEGTSPWEDFIKRWTEMLSAPLPNPLSATRGAEDLAGLSKPWQEHVMNLQKAWISCMQAAAKGPPAPAESSGEETNNALDAWMKCCGECMDIWLRFADDQSKTFSRFLNAGKTEGKALEKPPKKVKVKDKKGP